MPISKLSALSLLLAASLTLAGCNPGESIPGASADDSGDDTTTADSGDSGSDETTDSGTTDSTIPNEDTGSTSDLIGLSGDAELSGRAADGYLEGATVCLDLNNSDTCDDGEPSATTGAGGHFTITGATDAQIQHGKILIIADENTVDTDITENDGKVGSEFILTAAPGDGAFVSPLTTMIQTTLENNPTMNDREARELVAEAVGLELSEADQLVENYIESGSTQANTLYKVSQLTTRIQQQARTRLRDTYFSGSSLAEAQFRRISRNIIQSYIDDQMSDITQWASANQNAELHKIDSRAGVAVDAIMEDADAAEVFAQRQNYFKEAVESQPALNNEAVIRNGFYNLWNFSIYTGDGENYRRIEYTRGQLRDSGMWFGQGDYHRDGASSWQEQFYQSADDGEKTPVARDGSTERIVDPGYFGMAPFSGYANERSESYVFHDDGDMTATLKYFLNGVEVSSRTSRVELRFRTQDVSGQPVVGYFQRHHIQSPSTTAVFPEGSQLIQTSFGANNSVEWDWYDVGYHVFSKDPEDDSLEAVVQTDVTEVGSLAGKYLRAETEESGYLLEVPATIGTDGTLKAHNVSETYADGETVMTIDDPAGNVSYQVVTLDNGITALRLDAQEALDLGLRNNLYAVLPGMESSSYPGGNADDAIPETINSILIGTTPQYRIASGQRSFEQVMKPSLNPTAFHAVADVIGLPSQYRF